MYINIVDFSSAYYGTNQLLQHSGLGSNTGMGFLRTNDLSEIETGELNLDFGVWLKTGKWMVCN